MIYQLEYAVKTIKIPLTRVWKKTVGLKQLEMVKNVNSCLMTFALTIYFDSSFGKYK